MRNPFLTLAASALLLGGCASLPPPATIAGEAERPAQALSAAPGLVSAADPRAAEAGAAMLRQGGSATDAAIATMLALNVVEPQSSGIGGGGFYVRGAADGSIETLDGRETAPRAATSERFLDESGEPLPFMQAVMSGLSVGVPGNLALAAEAHARYGRLAWAELFAPAIALARDGFTVTPRLHEYLARFEDRAGMSEAGRALYYDADGEALAVGARIANPDLAGTLERIAADGPQAFYSGPAAEMLAGTVASATPSDGTMRPSDLAAYEALWRPAQCGAYREYRICGMGPPSSGATTVFAILKQLEGFDMALHGPDTPIAWHLFAESQRLAYADRELYLADADFVSVPVAGLMDGPYLRRRGERIAPDARMEAVEPGTPPGAASAPADGDEPEEGGTSHFVAVDGEGHVVSYTSTVEGPFGSGLMTGGFYLNNELTDFSFSPQAGGRPVANRVEGGKRPRSSMAPTVVFGPEGDPYLVIGAAGGGTIPVQVAKALIGVLDWGLSAQEAIALPGLYSPGEAIMVEPGSPLLQWRAELEALGHTVMERELPFKANAAQKVAGRWVGAADPRSEGAAISE